MKKSVVFRSMLYGWYDFIAWLRDARTISVLVCVMVFLHENLSGVAEFADKYMLKFTPWLLPFMAATRIVDLVLWMALLLILCDLGSEKKIDLYVRLRLPQKAVRLGRIFSTFLRSTAYWLVIAISPILLFPRHIQYSMRWGKIIGTLAREAGEDAAGIYAIRFSQTIVNRYTPLQASCLCLLLSIMAGFIVGLFILIGNELFNNLIVGCGISGLFILVDFWLRTDPLACNRWIRFSFVTFHNLRCLNSIGRLGYVTLRWAVLFCLVVSFICIIFYMEFTHISEAKNAGYKKFVQVVRQNRNS